MGTMDALLLELERAAWEILDAKTPKEKNDLAQRVLEIKSNIRKLSTAAGEVSKILRRVCQHVTERP